MASWVIQKYVRNLLLIASIAVLVGCDGGLIGTGSGPIVPENGNSGGQGPIEGSTDPVASGDSAYQLVYLPSRIAPRMPASLLASSAAKRGSVVANGGLSQRMTTSVVGVEVVPAAVANDAAMAAQNWQLLTPSFSVVEKNRVQIQVLLTLLDSVYLQITQLCQQQMSAVCRLADGVVRVDYSEQLQQQLMLLPRSMFSTEASLLTEVIGTQLSFGPLVYQRLTGGSYTQRLQLSSATQLEGREFELRWNADSSQVLYRLAASEGAAAELYYYQSVETGQRLTVRNAGASQIVQAQSTDTQPNDPLELEINAGVENDGDVIYSARIAQTLVSGRATNDEAYGYTIDFDQPQLSYLQETFLPGGELTATQQCEFDSVDDACLMQSLESDLSASPESVDNGLADFGLQRVVLELPTDVRQFEIVAKPGSSVTAELYCIGWQVPVGEITTYCFIDPALAVGGVAVSIDQFGNRQVLTDVALALRKAQ